MRRGVLVRLLLCIFFAALLLYSYIDRLNEMTQLKFEIPKLESVVKRLREENDALKLQIECTQQPVSLMKRLREPEFSHLKQPSRLDVLVIEE